MTTPTHRLAVTIAILGLLALPGCQRLARGGAAPAGSGSAPAAGKAALDKGEQAPVAVDGAPATLGEVTQPIEVSGTVVPDSEVRILPKLTGRLLWVVEEWARVQAGQEIARIETPELSWQTQQARAVVGTAKAGLNLAQANLQNAREMAGRVELQFKEGAANPQQRDQAVNAQRVATAQVEQARAQIAQAEAGVKVFETQQGNARITSPVSGVVTGRLVDIGGMANPTQPILVIANARRRLVKAAVSERDLRLVRTGMRAEVTSVAYPDRTFHGTLIETSPALDIPSRTVPAKIQLAAADVLKFGMSVTVRLQSDSRRGLVIPASAVQQDGAGHAVFLAKGGKAFRVPVEVGARMSGKVEIRSGLAAGDPVIQKGADFLKDGDPVKVAGK